MHTPDIENAPLAGVKVVELGVWIAGPATAGMLADWGADVVKVEAPGGDPQRHVLASVGLADARLPPFEVDNRGKRGIVLDLKTDEGLADMNRLLDEADVFVTNLGFLRCGHSGSTPTPSGPPVPGSSTAWSRATAPTARTPIAPPTTSPASGLARVSPTRSPRVTWRPPRCRRRSVIT